MVFAICFDGKNTNIETLPEPMHEDAIGTFGKAVHHAVYTLDAIYGADPRGN